MALPELARIADAFRGEGVSAVFTILEIGARPLQRTPEPFYAVVEKFPGSRIIGFEPDPGLCEQLNEETPEGIRYYPAFLGRAEERRPFYETEHPMCSSLYKPNALMMERYNNLEMSRLKSEHMVETVSLDHFTRANGVGPVDFVKIDIQGAELDVFQGGTETLRDTVAVVSETEFVELYENQPLFGDVTGFLGRHGLNFHKFIGLSGRSLKPVTYNGNPNHVFQHMWADSMYLRDIPNHVALDSDRLLKMGVVGYLYGSLDVAVTCFRSYDLKNGTRITNALVNIGE